MVWEDFRKGSGDRDAPVLRPDEHPTRPHGLFKHPTKRSTTRHSAHLSFLRTKLLIPVAMSTSDHASSCVVLGDKAVQSILLGLDRAGVARFRDDIAQSLADFSTTSERQYQPDSSSITRPDGRSILFRPFTSPAGPGVKIVVDPTTPNASPIAEGKPKPTLHGVLVVCDEDGRPAGLVNSDEITAFRTAMSVIIPYCWRKNTRSVVIFGAGKVALWLARLMLALRIDDIRQMTVVNRSIGRAEELVATLEADQTLQHRATLRALTSEDSGLIEAVRTADVICCSTPSSKPLFPASWVEKCPFISGIGSWQPSMIELDPKLFQRAAAMENGAVIVDDRTGSQKVSGEIIQSQLAGEQILELGAIIASSSMLQSSGDDAIASSSAICEGLVLYKSIGVSMTDLTAANALLSLAKSSNHGILVPDF
jgi:ornithine cyclodeaminase/alanine dehydrogenase-like protein (mu-crystallin family)